MTVLYGDTETYSTVPIKNGTAAYAEGAEVMLFTYAIDENPAQLWDITKGEPMPTELKEALNDSKIKLVFHNSVFDLTVIRESLKIDIPIERVHCTMAQAYAHGLPGSLDTLSQIFHLSTDKAKDKKGKKLIQLFCVPRKTGSIPRATYKTHPVEWDAFCAYAKLDIDAMREVYKKMPSWNYTGREYKLWCLDAKINRRGIAIDTDLAKAAVEAVSLAQKNLAERTQELSLGDLESTSQRNETLRHIFDAYGVSLPDLQMSTLERRIEDPNLPIELKELLSIRLQVSSTSTAKYSKLLKAVSKDGRIRNTLQWCGASRTGRDSGRTFQPQNLPRPNLKQDVIDFGIEALKCRSADLLFDNVMELTSNTIRGCIIAEPGNKLLVADLSNIEGRYAAWIAGEKWKLDAFKLFDAGEGPDLYALAYAKSFGVTPESVMLDKKNGGIQRVIGKVMELALQFGGGVGAFSTFALNYGIDLNILVEKAWNAIPERIKEEAEKYYYYCLPRIEKDENGNDYMTKDRTCGLEKRVFITCDSLKRLWREAHPRIVAMWWELDEAVKSAIYNKRKEIICGKLKIIRQGNWLRIIMPSGRSLTYPGAKINSNGDVIFRGMDQYTRKFQDIWTYGPKEFENVVQGGSRDIFMAGVTRVNEEWLLPGNVVPTVTRIHDEQICEVPDEDFYSLDKLCVFMTEDIDWAPDLPLAAAGFETYRYKKEA